VIVAAAVLPWRLVTVAATVAAVKVRCDRERTCRLLLLLLLDGTETVQGQQRWRSLLSLRKLLTTMKLSCRRVQLLLLILEFGKLVPICHLHCANCCRIMAEEKMRIGMCTSQGQELHLND
jgi:hypothetical protein